MGSSPAITLNPMGKGVATGIVEDNRRNLLTALTKPESTEAMGRGVDTRDDGQGKANGASPIPIDGDEGGVR